MQNQYILQDGSTQGFEKRKERTMTREDAKLRKEILKRFEFCQTIFFSTCSGNKPKVRPVSLMYLWNKFWITTGGKDAKVRQLKKNRNFEFCVLLETRKYVGYIRASGKAKLIKDLKTRKKFVESVELPEEFSKDFQDPGFALLRLDIQEIEYKKPGAWEVKKLKFK
jgi:uncharacterized pyridoxamine 5'-phosphate oxidase family protein